MEKLKASIILLKEKPVLLLGGAVAILAIIILGSMLLFPQTPKQIPQPPQQAPMSVPPEQLPSPTPTLYPSISTPPEEKISPISTAAPEWIFKLPLKDALYYADYDPQSQIIKVLLYPLEYSSIPINLQVDYLKDKVKKELQQIGVDINKTKIDWEVK